MSGLEVNFGLGNSFFDSGVPFVPTPTCSRCWKFSPKQNKRSHGTCIIVRSRNSHTRDFNGKKCSLKINQPREYDHAWVKAVLGWTEKASEGHAIEAET